MHQGVQHLSADDLANRIWQELKRALHDRQHQWRTPVLATQGIDASGPQARTVVLRHADAASWQLSIYTDARSPKCIELKSQPLAQMIFWSKRLNWQLRVSTLATIEYEGEQVNAAWHCVKHTRGSADYLSANPPGQTPVDGETTNIDEFRMNHHLAVVNFKVKSMDWLALRQEGHRRARLTPSGTLVWVTP